MKTFRQFVGEEIPSIYGQVTRPKRIDHIGGRTISGANQGVADLRAIAMNPINSQDTAIQAKKTASQLTSAIDRQRFNYALQDINSSQPAARPVPASQPAARPVSASTAKNSFPPIDDTGGFGQLPGESLKNQGYNRAKLAAPAKSASQTAPASATQSKEPTSLPGFTLQSQTKDAEDKFAQVTRDLSQIHPERSDSARLDRQTIVPGNVSAVNTPPSISSKPAPQPAASVAAPPPTPASQPSNNSIPADGMTRYAKGGGLEYADRHHVYESLESFLRNRHKK